MLHLWIIVSVYKVGYPKSFSATLLKYGTLFPRIKQSVLLFSQKFGFCNEFFNCLNGREYAFEIGVPSLNLLPLFK